MSLIKEKIERGTPREMTYEDRLALLKTIKRNYDNKTLYV